MDVPLSDDRSLVVEPSLDIATDTATGPTLWISIDNVPELAAAYGDGFALEVVASLLRRAQLLIAAAGGKGSASRVGNWLCIRGFTGNAPRRSETVMAETLLLQLGRAPICIDDACALPRLSVTFTTGTSPAALGGAKSCVLGEAESYAEDMRLAVMVRAAIEDHRLYLLRQPIAVEPTGDQILYYECLARIASNHGDLDLIPAQVFIPALERLGLIREFDRSVVQETISLLRREPDVCLGCNISALSAVYDVWWASIFETLAQEPRLAERLVIELTETAVQSNTGPTVAFLDKLRMLGCRVAIDDFGAGFSSLSLVAATRPDIIKIDGSFVSEKMERTFGRRLLRSLAELSAALAIEVVIEGVESTDDIARARRAGITWLQGFHIGRPDFFRLVGGPPAYRRRRKADAAPNR